MGERRVPYTGMRKFIGDSMLRSVTTYPQARSYINCDMGALLKLQEEYKNGGHKISTTALMVKLIGTALKKFPELNCRMEGNEIVYYDQINCAVAIDIGNGLYILTIRDVDKKSLIEVDADLRDLIERTKNNKLTLDDMKGSTFTLNCFATMRAEYFESIIVNDQCIIVGVGGINKQVIVDENDQIVIRPIAKVIVNMNHALCDGKTIYFIMDHIYEICKNPKEFIN